jgi:hypothetical protein
MHAGPQTYHLHVWMIHAKYRSTFIDCSTTQAQACTAGCEKTMEITLTVCIDIVACKYQCNMCMPYRAIHACMHTCITITVTVTVTATVFLFEPPACIHTSVHTCIDAYSMQTYMRACVQTSIHIRIHRYMLIFRQMRM